MKFKLNVSAASFSRDKWTINQDNLVIDDEISSISDSENFVFEKAFYLDKTRVFAVSDGIGGGKCGEKASKMTVEAIASCLESIRTGDMRKETVKSIGTANDAVTDFYRKNHHPFEGGATLSMLAFRGDSVLAANLGDSPIFRLRTEDKKSVLEQLNFEHTVANECPENARDEKVAKNTLTKYSGAPGLMAEDAYVCDGDLRWHDVYLICSDGIVKGLSNDRIVDYMKKSIRSPGRIALQMVKEARETANDDVTAVVICVKRARNNNALSQMIAKAFLEDSKNIKNEEEDK